MKKTTNKKSPPGRLTLILTALLFPEKVRIGVAEGIHCSRIYVLTVNKAGTWYPVYTGENIPRLFRIWFPQAYYGDSGPVAIHLHSANISPEEDPDSYIEKNEELFLPQGFEQEKIETGYATGPYSINAASVVKNQIDIWFSEYEKTGWMASCFPSLQGLANVCGNRISGNYILWKVTDEGSTFARVEEGVVKACCRFWAGTEDLKREGETICKDARELITTMDNGEYISSIACYPGVLSEIVKSVWPDNAVQIVPVPDVRECPEEAIEAFGNCYETDKAIPQMLSFEKQQLAIKRDKVASLVVRSGRYAAMCFIGIMIVCAGYIGVSGLTISNDRDEMNRLDREYATVLNAVDTRDSLFKELSRKSAFVAEESALTRLLSELQVAFPEGTAAEEMLVDEVNGDSWRLTIRAFSRSTSLMQPVMDNLEKIKGLQDVRMIYSERVNDKKYKTGLRFKVEAIWR